MPTIHLTLDGEGAWPELAKRPEVIYLPDAAVWQLAALEGGMASGAPSLGHRVVEAARGRAN